MLMIDIPVGILSGLVIADAGRYAIKTGNRDFIAAVRQVALAFAYLITTPVTIYFFIGWPAWETNYFWKWVDNIRGTPHLALSAFMVIALSVIPTIIGFETGKLLIKKKKVQVLRASYIFICLLILVIVYLFRDVTFTVAATYADYENKHAISFWSMPFFIYWLTLTILFWGALLGCYLYVFNLYKRM